MTSGQSSRENTWPPLPNTSPNESINHVTQNGFHGNALHTTPRSRFDYHSNASSSTPRRHSTMTLPNLPTDQSHMTPRNSKMCSFVRNHKTYLKLKGFDVTEVYSLNRHNKTKPVKSSAKKQIGVLSNSESDLPKLVDHRFNTKRKLPVQTTGSNVWRPRDSTNPRSSRVLDKDLIIPGYVRSTDVKSQRLGKVLTKTHLRKLLTQEEPLIPKAFCMNSTGST